MSFKELTCKEKKSFVRALFSLCLILSHNVFAQSGLWSEDGLECVLEPNARIFISAAVPGLIDQVLVQRGDTVEAGQLLATLVSGPEQAAIELAEVHVAFEQRKAVRNEDLYLKELVSIHEKDEMDTEILMSNLRLKQAEEQLKLRKIFSPIRGVIIEREKDPGEYVETEPLFTVVNLNPLNVEAVAPAELFGKIKKGMRGKVRVLALDSKSYHAKVTLIDQLIDVASGTIRVRLALPNPKNAIPAGHRCFVKIE